MGYTLYINFENFTFEVGECIGTAKRNLWHCWAVKNPRLLKSALTFIVCEVLTKLFMKAYACLS